MRPKGPDTDAGFPSGLRRSSGSVLYKDANFLVETLPTSQLDLNATLHLAANFQWFKLTAMQAQLTGTASFELRCSRPGRRVGGPRGLYSLDYTDAQCLWRHLSVPCQSGWM